MLQYLIMQVLSSIWKAGGEGAKIHYRFGKFCFSVSDVEKIIPQKDTVVSAAFKVGIGERSGFVKLIFARTFLEKVSTVATSKDITETSYFLDKAAKFDYIRGSIWAEGGRSSVSYDEMIALESGDVILFDETGLVLQGSKLSGEVNLRVGQGEEGGLRAEILTEKDNIRCTIIGR